MAETPNTPGSIATIEEVQPAPFSGTIFSVNAAAKLLLDLQYNEESCKINIERDVNLGDVRCIILIEDRPRYYSTILPLIYKEITRNIKRLMDKSLNDTERLLHMRARPKILLTTTYEEAQDFFKKYQQNTIGIISDIRFPKNGIHDPEAGQSFVRWARSVDPSIPILLQYRHEINAQIAKELHVNFVNKKSKSFHQELRDFITTNFGFGDFIFKTPKSINFKSNFISIFNNSKSSANSCLGRNI